MSTHPAVITTAIRAPLETIQLPTIKPEQGEVRVRVEWTASSPLDLHQNDGGLLVTYPQVLGDTVAGTVVEIGPGVDRLSVGDKVFGPAWREQKEKAQQEYVTVAEILLGKLPLGFTLQQAATLPSSFITVFHAVTADLGLPLPWPRPSALAPPLPQANSPILIWGGSSSVGQFALQILSSYGYRNLITTASKPHHAHLRSLGAANVFDYKDADATGHILEAAKTFGTREPVVPFVLDCIGSKNGSVEPIARIAQKGTTIAVLLPIIVTDASETVAPEYAMDAQASSSENWKEGVHVKGVSTHFYLQNEFFKDHLTSTIMPALLAEKVVTPLRQRVVEGETLLERAQRAIDILRRREVSGERLVWRVAG